MAYFWCLDHSRVEGEQGCRAEVRLGPFPDEASAARALQSHRERQEQLDREDEQEREG